MKMIIGNVNTGPSCSYDPSRSLCLYRAGRLALTKLSGMVASAQGYLGTVLFNNECFMPPVTRCPPKRVFS